MKMSETRAHQIGTCPACQAPLEMVLRVELGEAKVSPPMPGGHVTVDFEFAQPSVTGAVLKPHDCMAPKDQPQPRGGLSGGSCRS